jgi:predicted dehydrogenase
MCNKVSCAESYSNVQVLIVFTVLGTFKGADSIIANRRSIIQLLNKDGSIAVKDYHKTADDTIMVQGIVQDGTPVSINLRGGRAFKDTPGMDWRIYGETGEIRITATGAFIHIGYPDIVVLVHDFASDEVEVVEIGNDRFEDLPLPARNVAKVYEAFANDDESVLCDFQDAVVRHRFIEILYKQNGS